MALDMSSIMFEPLMTVGTVPFHFSIQSYCTMSGLSEAAMVRL